MLFPTHLLAAALLGRRLGLSRAWLIVGAALPDLIDKPLAMAGIVDLYHTVGHSALLLAVLLPVALSGTTGRALAVGWLSHLCLDAFHVIVNGRPGDALFLAWPVLIPPNPLALPPGAFVGHYVGSPAFVIELGLWLGAIAVTIRRWQRAGPPIETRFSRSR